MTLPVVSVWLAALRARVLGAVARRSVLLVLAAACVQCASTPERHAALEDARAASELDGTFLVAAFGATSCAPCRQMDEETWSDARVERWLETHGRLLRVDVERDPASAAEYRVRAFPTIVVFRGGRELDRVRGHRGTDALLAWLDGLREGTTELQRLAREHASRPADPVVALELAEAELAAGDARAAALVLASMWDLERGGSLDLASLVTLTREAVQEEAARGPFVARLDALEARLGDDASLESWLRLASLLGEHDRAARWFVALEDRAARKSTLVAARPELWTSLRAAGRRDAIVQLVELSVPAVEFARHQARIPAELRADAAGFAALREENRARLDDLEVGLVGLGRNADAERVRASRDELLRR